MGTAEVVRYLTRHGSGRIARLVLSGTVTPMLLQSADNPDGIPADVAVQSRAAMLRDIGDWMDMSGKAEYFSGEHRVSQHLLDWTLNTIAAVPLPILTQTSDAFLHADFRSELTRRRRPRLVPQRVPPLQRSATRVHRLRPGAGHRVDAELELTSPRPGAMANGSASTTSATPVLRQSADDDFADAVADFVHPRARDQLSSSSSCSLPLSSSWSFSSSLSLSSPPSRPSPLSLFFPATISRVAQ